MGLWNFFERAKHKVVDELPVWDSYTPWRVGPTFTPETCDKIIALGKALNQWDAKVAGKNTDELNTRIRASRVTFIKPTEENQWLFKRMELLCTQHNDMFYGLDLISFPDGFQFTEYRIGGFYTWHQDLGKGKHSKRKLSFSLQLSDPLEYDGGDIEFFGSSISTAPRARGSMVLFPSFTFHRVTPVTRGVRYSLVGWMYGPHFR
jgi:PKHD-type hydroxylase